MNPIDHEFRERLVAMEHTSPALNEQYREEIRAMLQRQVTGIRRWIWLAAAIFALIHVVLFGVLAITVPTAIPWVGQVGFGAGAVVALGWAILGIRVFVRGTLHLRLDTGFVAALSWTLPVLLVTIFLIAAPDTINGLRMILFGLVFLLIGAVFLIRHLIEQAELRAREKLLEIEYRLATLAEALNSKSR